MSFSKTFFVLFFDFKNFLFLEFLFLCFHYQYIPTCLLLFSLSHFSILIIVILNSPTVLSSVSYMSLVIILFCLLRLFYFSCILHTLGFFCWKLNILYWVLGTELNSLLAWGFISVWLGAGLSLVFTVLYVPKASAPLVPFPSPLLSSPGSFVWNLLLSYWSPVYVEEEMLCTIWWNHSLLVILGLCAVTCTRVPPLC